MRRIFTILTLGLAACDSASYQYGGRDVFEYFPLDGLRSWEYLQQDTTVDWQMTVEKLTATQDINGMEVITLEHAVKDPIELLYSVRWSSDSAHGVLIHGWADADGTDTTYDTPVIFGEYQMTAGESVVTETNGLTFTSTLIAVESCPNEWTSDEWECLHFTLDDGDGDDMAGPPFAGDYWIATKYGTSWFQPTGYTTPWVLSKATWSAEE